MRIAIVGNCQSWLLQELLGRLAPRLAFSEPIIIHLARAEEAERQLAALAAADRVLTQLVLDTYPVEHLRTAFLKDRFGERAVVWPNVFFRGQNPDLVYISHERGRLCGPLTQYHSRALFDAWREGVDLGDIRPESFMRRSRDVEDYRAAIDRSFDDLEERERRTDVGVADLVRERWRHEPLFHTFNHPTNALIGELALRIARRLNLATRSPRRMAKVPERLGTIRPPMEAPLAEALGLAFAVSPRARGVEVRTDGDEVVTGAGRDYDFAEFARASYACYDAQRALTDAVRFTPAQ